MCKSPRQSESHRRFGARNLGCSSIYIFAILAVSPTAFAEASPPSVFLPISVPNSNARNLYVFFSNAPTPFHARLTVSPSPTSDNETKIYGIDSESPDTKSNLHGEFMKDKTTYRISLLDLPIRKYHLLGEAPGSKSDAKDVDLSKAKDAALTLKVQTANVKISVDDPSPHHTLHIEIKRAAEVWNPTSSNWEAGNVFSGASIEEDKIKSDDEQGFPYDLKPGRYQITVTNKETHGLATKVIDLSEGKNLLPPFTASDLERELTFAVHLKENESEGFRFRIEVGGEPVGEMAPDTAVELSGGHVGDAYLLYWLTPQAQEVLVGSGTLADNMNGEAQKVTLDPMRFGKDLLIVDADFEPEEVDIRYVNSQARSHAVKLYYSKAIPNGRTSLEYLVDAGQPYVVQVVKHNVHSKALEPEKIQNSTDKTLKFDEREFSEGTISINYDYDRLGTLHLEITNLNGDLIKEMNTSPTTMSFEPGRFRVAATATIGGKRRRIPLGEELDVVADAEAGAATQYVIPTEGFFLGKLRASLTGFGDSDGNVKIDASREGSLDHERSLGESREWVVHEGTWKVTAILGNRPSKNRTAIVSFGETSPVEFSRDDFVKGTLIVYAPENLRDSIAIRDASGLSAQLEWDPDAASIGNILVPLCKGQTNPIQEGRWYVESSLTHLRKTVTVVGGDARVVAMFSNADNNNKMFLEQSFDDEIGRAIKGQLADSSESADTIPIADSKELTASVPSPTGEPVSERKGGSFELPQISTNPPHPDETHQWSIGKSFNVVLPDELGTITMVWMAGSNSWLGATVVPDPHRENRPKVFSYEEAQSFIDRLNERQRGVYGDYKFALPTFKLWKEAAGKWQLSEKMVFDPQPRVPVSQGMQQSEFFNLRGNVWQWIVSSGDGSPCAVGGSFLTKASEYPESEITWVKDRNHDYVNIGLRLALLNGGSN